MMKKILAMLIAGLMMLSMVACDLGNTEDPNKDNSGISQSGENNNGGETIEWPSAASEIEWTGSGKIICAEKLIGSSRGEVEVYIDKATLAEVGEYISKVKAFGIDCSDEPESALEFNDNGIFSWAGLGNSFQITLWQDEGPGRGYVDGSYQLKIVVPTEAGIFK